MIKQTVANLLYRALEKPLPALTSQENEFLSEIRSTFQGFPVADTTGALPSEKIWADNMNRLREHVISGNPREFLRWDVILKTMFVNQARYISTELNFLKNSPEWAARWRPAIAESPVGHPPPYIFYPDSSGNLIHHAYHLAQFEKKSGMRVQDTDFVFEFGGGYGSMCRLLFNLGFRGKYVIFDLPPFAALQKYYLKTIGLPVYPSDSFSASLPGVACLSDASELDKVIAGRAASKNPMFIATWSISESPVAVRRAILPLISDFKAFLIAYQANFAEIDNVAFFNSWKNKLQRVAWSDWQIEYTPGQSYYLVGISK